MTGKYWVGIDIGGTFTDMFVIEKEGSIYTTKSSSTPMEPDKAVIECIRKTGIKGCDIEMFFLGTTVGVNTIVTGRGTKTGLVTTQGFRDVLEIRRAHRLADPLNLYNIQQELPKPLAPRRWRMEVAERVLSDGNVLIPLDEEGLKRVINELKKQGVESIAVSFIFSFVNPQHEKRAIETVRKEYPEAYSCSSIEISPVIREYERVSTTVASAFTGPIVKSHTATIMGALKKMEYPRDYFLVMTSSGGVMTHTDITERAVFATVSGLAADASAARHIGELTGNPNIICFDMGGTSCEAIIVPEGKVPVTTEKEIGYHKIAIPIIDVNVIGQGGGSIAWIDKGGILRVGPDSAGAEPGPIAYGKGGTRATITDANLILGYIPWDYFLGGEMKVDINAAKRTIEEQLMKPMGLKTPEEAAYSVFRVANSNMEAVVRIVSVGRGYDPRDFALVAMGGSGPVHVSSIARALGIRKIIIPPWPGITSAMGLLLSDIRHEFRRSYVAPTRQANVSRINDVFAEQEKMADEHLVRDGVSAEKRRFMRSLDMRYLGQAHEVSVDISTYPREVTREVLDAAVKQFHELHEMLYGFKAPEEETMIVTLGVSGVGHTLKPRLPEHEYVTESPSKALKREREAYFPEMGGWVRVSTYERSKLVCGNRIEGPAIVEQMDTTTLILPGQKAEVDKYLNIIIT